MRNRYSCTILDFGVCADLSRRTASLGGTLTARAVLRPARARIVELAALLMEFTPTALAITPEGKTGY
jgi:hypothetical protein